MPATNPALILAGPCVLVGRGISLHTKDAVQLEPRLGTFPIETSEFGEAELREDDFNFGLGFTPDGHLGSLAAMYPYATRLVGELAHLTEKITAINTGTEVLTAVANRFRDGHAVRWATDDTKPAIIVLATLYYWHRLTADTGSLHATEAAALAGTSPVNFADAGTGTQYLIEQEPITLWSLREGRGYILHNTIVESQPDLQPAGNRTAFGRVGFRVMRRHGVDPTDAAAMFTATTSAPTYSAFDPANVPTAALAGTWGSAPWASFKTKDGFRASFATQWEDVREDGAGVISLRLAGRGAEIRCSPRGISDTAAFAALVAQNTGAGQGRRLTGSNFDIDVTGLHARLYAASLINAPMAWDRREDRLGELVWRANQSFASGVPNPLFAVSTTTIA